MIEEPRNQTDDPAIDAADQPAPTGEEDAVADAVHPDAGQADAGHPDAGQPEVTEQSESVVSESAADEVAAEVAPAAEADAAASIDTELDEAADDAADEVAATEEVATADESAAAYDQDAADDQDDDAEVDSSGAIEDTSGDIESSEMDWYILKVQSNRERSIAEALQRKIAIEGLDRFFGQVIVPTEKVTEFKGGKKKIVERKLWPGYIVVNMHINDDTWFAVRETAGIGDFTGAAGKPTPMQAHEVAKIIQQDDEESEEAPKLAIKFKPGDKVKVKDGNFESFEGEVGTIDEASGRVTVMINIFGRSTPVELEYWQIESM
jgi:transcriptional antiterminator NusG